MANIYSPDEYFKITNQNIKNIVATQQLIGKLLGVIAARTGLTNELKEIIAVLRQKNRCLSMLSIQSSLFSTQCLWFA
ncbi:hypothetical protein AB3359_002940 [Escherichia coli]